MSINTLCMFAVLLVLALAEAVHATAKFRYAIFEESCFEAFFTHHDFFNIPCLKLVRTPRCRPSASSSATVSSGVPSR